MYNFVINPVQHEEGKKLKKMHMIGIILNKQAYWQTYQEFLNKILSDMVTYTIICRIDVPWFNFDRPSKSDVSKISDSKIVRLKDF